MLSEKGYEHNVGYSKLEEVYTSLKQNVELRLYEVTFTFIRQRCKNITECKRRAMGAAIARAKGTDPEHIILVQELHADGWPHVHGIVAYKNDLDSHECLKTNSSRWDIIGRSTVYDCRNDPYIVRKPVPFGGVVEYTWDHHLQYICKDLVSNKNVIKDLTYVYSLKSTPLKRKKTQDEIRREIMLLEMEQIELKRELKTKKK